MLVTAIADRMAEVGLRLHPAKTRIVYCKDANRRGGHEHTSFTFLGFTFRARAARNRNGQTFTAFLPAISKDALNKLSGAVRRWRLHHWTGLSLIELASWVNPIVRGWMQYYGAFYRSERYPSYGASTSTWCAGSARSSSGCDPSTRPRRAGSASPARTPAPSPTGHGSCGSDDQDDTSRVTGDCHARNLWEPGGETPPGHPAG
jgi:hypothetical protein